MKVLNVELGDVGQWVIEHLLSMPKALGSIPALQGKVVNVKCKCLKIYILLPLNLHPNSRVFVFVSVLFCLAILGVKLRALKLLGRCSMTWVKLPTLFVLVTGFEIGSYFMTKSAWTIILLFVLSHVDGNDRHLPPDPAISWDGGLWNFLLRLALLISASQVARIRGLSHHTWTLALGFVVCYN
jgi:hypothetical protein